ncbi:MAG: hypothetical protein KF757_00910 [Phycisphaeraceae bacterium]|nr:hypothetical protein [Phycisphaeraceae bacterium]MCW5761767.1 hypothetical protein [Phycisphaeraceae bacterium]
MPALLVACALASTFLTAQPAAAAPATSPPALALADHLRRTRENSRLIPTLVIVRDEPSYLSAISKWTSTTRFPVLLHDGSIEAAEDIARFCRAFEPSSVIEYHAANAQAWTRDRDSRIRRIEHTLFEATTGRTDFASMLEWTTATKQTRSLTPGLVVADPEDTLWPAALALAAGRSQPIIFTRSPGRINTALSLEDAFTLERFLRDAAQNLDLAWAGINDDVDAITLALQVPVKVRSREEPPDFLATTDFLSRSDPPARSRWAFVGQLHGSQARAAYLAMSSLFLGAHSAWLFDGYSSERGWDEYDATRAANTLKNLGWTTTLFDEPRQSLEVWRAAAVRPLNADLVFVNSMGNPEFFRLRPGDASPGDVPLLTRPIAVHFVHSFSLARPADRDTVGGRWLAHGAYAYFGSVHEPQLAAFVPTPRVAARLAAGLPFAAAVRYDTGEPWKLAVIADPLLTLGPPLPRIESALALDPTTNLGDRAAQAVGEHRFTDAIELFSLLGRDSDAVRLTQALRREQPDSITPDLAKAALMPMFRAGRPDDVVALFRALAPADREQEIFLDALWHAARLRLYTDPATTDLLRQHLRPGQIAADALELADVIAHQHDRHAAAGFLNSMRPRVTSPRDQRQIDRRVSELLRNTPSRP